jgi:hypothetical protein
VNFNQTLCLNASLFTFNFDYAANQTKSKAIFVGKQLDQSVVSVYTQTPYLYGTFNLTLALYSLFDLSVPLGSFPFNLILLAQSNNTAPHFIGHIGLEVSPQQWYVVS